MNTHTNCIWNIGFKSAIMQCFNGVNIWVTNVHISVCICIYRVSQEERAKLREGVPYVKLYRYNPKHLYPKLNGYGDNGQRNLKLWQLLHTYWLPNSYWHWQAYVVSVMLIYVLNIKVTCEWHKAINLNSKVHHIRVVVILTVPITIHHIGMLNGDITCLPASHDKTMALLCSVITGWHADDTQTWHDVSYDIIL
jgi:hypothetical protein